MTSIDNPVLTRTPQLRTRAPRYRPEEETIRKQELDVLRTNLGIVLSPVHIPSHWVFANLVLFISTLQMGKLRLQEVTGPRSKS